MSRTVADLVDLGRKEFGDAGVMSYKTPDGLPFVWVRGDPKNQEDWAKFIWFHRTLVLEGFEDVARVILQPGSV